MTKFLIKFWPALTPIILLIIWWVFIKKRTMQTDDDTLPQWESRLWLWTFLLSVLIAAGVLIFTAVTEDSSKGTYIPPSVVDGEVIPGRMMKDDETQE